MSRSVVEVLERPQSSRPSESNLTRAEDEEDEEMRSASEVEEEESEMDEAEAELERLVFGDSAGFRQGLKVSALAAREAGEDDEQADGLDDADVGQAFKAQCSS